MVPNTRFAELLADIEPSPTTKAYASSAHNGVRGHLKAHTDFEQHWVSDFLAGSYKRDTAIRPRKIESGVERADVDIIIVTSYDTTMHPDKVLKNLADALDSEFPVERINKRSVRVSTLYAEMDLVPVVSFGSIYQLPDRDLGTWKATNPPGHTAWSTTQNQRFAGRFKPLVKLLKWWKRENPSGKRPKGFVLEMLAALHAPTAELVYSEAFTQMLENIYRQYGTSAELGIKPVIYDPSITNPSDILSKVSITDWKGFMARVGTHAGYARRAQNTDDMEEATRLWRRVFGDRFRATVQPAKATTMAAAALAPARMSAPYTFPNTPAAPTKPRGFA